MYPRDYSSNLKGADGGGKISKDCEHKILSETRHLVVAPH